MTLSSMLEDAGRADQDFLVRIIEAAIKAGATVVNIPDTTGYNMPWAFGARIRDLRERVDGIENAIISVHTHNDLGMATALAIEAVRNGATQVECTINGLGERAGNTALEEVVMAIRMHGQELDAHTDIVTQELTPRLQARELHHGYQRAAQQSHRGRQRFRALLGHPPGWCSQGARHYEIIDPADVGAGGSQIILSARSGHAALRHRMAELGYTFADDEFEKIYESFLEVADKKKEVYDEDLESIVHERERVTKAIWTLGAVQVSCGFPLTPTATLTLVDEDGGEHTVAAYGTGPVDAVYKAVNQIVMVEERPLRVRDQGRHPRHRRAG